MRKIYYVIICLAVLCTPAFTADVFEVKGVSTNNYLYRNGKIEKASDGGDQVVYAVDIPNKVVTRTAVFNAGFKSDDPVGGVQSDDSRYVIVRDSYNMVAKQWLIKAFGQVAADGGFEIVVIGENFICTSKSAADYYSLYYYKRTQ